jgi:DNA polymerase-3 subunit epsilon
MEALERIIFLDTETTGLDPRLGHRIIEVAGVEVVGRRLTGKHIHFFTDPGREIDAGATAVHGYTWEDLRGKPGFEAIAGDLLGFLFGARLVIHNAAFDVSFLDAEFARMRQPPISKRGLIIDDSLTMARQLFPGKRNSLDALCDRLGVDNSQRNLHGALLDARLLADVYLAMTRGQGTLQISLPRETAQHPDSDKASSLISESVRFYTVAVDAESRAAHDSAVRRLSTQSGVSRIW